MRKFKDRATAVSRIWKAIQTLGADPVATAEAALEAAPIGDQPQKATETAEPETPAPEANVAPQTPDVAPEATPAKVRRLVGRRRPKRPRRPVRRVREARPAKSLPCSSGTAAPPSK